jgi:enoyl-CoA hydratase/carnithine racemase
MTSDYAKLTTGTLVVEQGGKLLTITLNRPKELNPLDPVTLLELGECIAQADRDVDVEIILLRGAGRAFSAGGDLKNHLRVHQDAEAMRRMGTLAAAAMDRIVATSKLVIAVVEGLCVAGGLELILCCDLVIATETASFSDGHLNVALLPGSGGTQRMPRWTGPLRAKELMLTARFVDGKEALALGLVTYCWPAAELTERLASLSADLLRKSFAARAAIKYLVNQSQETPLSAGLQIERAFVQHFETTHPDAHEGILAFVEKRKPKFGPPG